MNKKLQEIILNIKKEFRSTEHELELHKQIILIATSAVILFGVLGFYVGRFYERGLIHIGPKDTQQKANSGNSRNMNVRPGMPMDSFRR